MLIDTVGLIRRLPHNLVEAFKSTLEEAANADIIINLIDISADDGYEQAKVTYDLLSELGCDDIPKINVLNKIDKLDQDTVIPEDSTTVAISARNHIGFNELLECISRNLPKTSKRGRYLIPYDKTALINRIREDGKIFSEEFTENGTIIDALVDLKIYLSVKEYSI